MRDPVSDNVRAEDDWVGGVTNVDGSMISLVDYVQDKSGGTAVNVFTFAKLNYNSEFETFLPGLTVTRDITCDWIMAQIMVMKVAED